MDEHSVELRECRVCHETKPITEFITAYGEPRRICRSCNARECKQRRREQLSTPEGRERFRAERRAYYRKRAEADPEWVKRRLGKQAKRPPRRPKEKNAANAALNYHVRIGNIVRPETCAECGGAGRIEAHHPDYSKPLDVEWLCSACHGSRHWKQEVVLHD